MNKKKKILIIGLIVLIVISAVLIILKLVGNNKENKTGEEKLNVCQKLINEISSNNQVILVYEANDTNKEDVDSLITKLKANYHLSNIFRINYTSNYSCLKKIETEESIKEITMGDVAIILYENGGNIGFSVDNYDYYVVEEFLSENNFIKKKDMKEKVALNEVKSKITQDNYVLLITQDEDTYNNAEKLMSEKYSQYDYDVINYRSSEGSKIYDYIAKNYKIIDEIPQFIYFNKGKIMSNDILDVNILSTVLK